MSDSESDNPQKKVTREFRDKVIKWIEIDDSIRELRAKTKELTTEKKQFEEYILSYMDQIEEKCFNIKDGKLRKNVSETKGPKQKQIIHQALVEIVGDSNKPTAMTEHIINSRPTVERVNLKRTKNRGPRKK